MGQQTQTDGITVELVYHMSDDEYPTLVDWRSTDSRGRINIGTEFAGERVKVAIIKTEDDPQ